MAKGLIRSSPLLLLLSLGCQDPAPPALTARDDVAAPRSVPAPGLLAPDVDAVDPEPTDPLGALLSLVRDGRGTLDGETRVSLVAAFDRVLARAARASRTSDLPRAVGSSAGTRVIQFVRDAVLDQVAGGMVVADGTVCIDEADDTLIVATDAAYVRACRGCVVLAGRLVVVAHAESGDEGARSLAWSAGGLDVADVTDTVLAGPGASMFAGHRGVLAADNKLLGSSVRLLAPLPPPVIAVAGEAADGQPALARLRNTDDGREERLTVGARVSILRGETPWRVVQAFGSHVALRRADDVVLLTAAD